MPTSGIVIRLRSGHGAAALRARLSEHSGLAGLELGEYRSGAIAGVIDAEDYPSHDAVLSALRDRADVCAVDIVFHDFSDTSEFPKLPARRPHTR